MGISAYSIVNMPDLPSSRVTAKTTLVIPSSQLGQTPVHM